MSPSLTDTKGTVTYTNTLPLPDGLSLNPSTGVISGVLGANAVSTAIEIRVRISISSVDLEAPYLLLGHRPYPYRL